MSVMCIKKAILCEILKLAAFLHVGLCYGICAMVLAPVLLVFLETSAYFAYQQMFANLNHMRIDGLTFEAKLGLCANFYFLIRGKVGSLLRFVLYTLYSAKSCMKCHQK